MLKWFLLLLFANGCVAPVKKVQKFYDIAKIPTISPKIEGTKPPSAPSAGLNSVENPKAEDNKPPSPKVDDTSDSLQFSSLAQHGNFCMDTNDANWAYWAVDGIQLIDSLKLYLIYYQNDLITSSFKQ